MDTKNSIIQNTKKDNLNKWKKLINRKIRPEERGNWNFAFVADEIGWFADYLSERKITPSAHFLIPVDLTEKGWMFCSSVLMSESLDTETTRAFSTLTILALSPFTSSWRNLNQLIEIPILLANFPHTIQT